MPGLRAVANLDEAKSNNVMGTGNGNGSSIKIPGSLYSTYSKIFQSDLHMVEYLHTVHVNGMGVL